MEGKKPGGSWAAVDIGDILPAGSSIRTGKSASCVIKFASLGALRVAENTTAMVDSFKDANRPSSVLVDLDVGTVVCKVKKLSVKDSFEVKTNLAVCGVRGTQFMVEALPDGKTVNVAVAEGAVSILPHSFDTVDMRAKAAESDAAANAMLATAATLMNLSPVVAAGQEASLDVSAMSKVNDAYDKLKAAAEKSAADKAAAEKAAAEKAAADKASSSKPAAGPTPAQVSAEVKKEEARKLVVSDLERSVVSKLDDVPLAPKKLSASARQKLDAVKSVELEAPQSSVPGAGDVGTTPPPQVQTAAPVPPPTTRSVEVEADPSDARISLDGSYVSSGRYTASLQRNRSYSFTAAREGYGTVIRALAPGAGDERIRLALQPTEVSFTVRSDPPEAMLFVGGKLVGSTPCRAAGSFGQSLPIKLSKPGFQDLQTVVDLQSGTPSTISLSLSPVPVTLKFKASPEVATISVDGKVLGVGACSLTRYPGVTVAVEVSAPGYAKEARTCSFGSVDSEIPIVLHSLKEIDREKLSSASLAALSWYAGSILYADASGTLGAVRVGRDLKIEPAWRLATKNSTMSVDQLRVRDGKLTLAGSAEWISLLPGTGEVVERDPVSGEFSSLSGRSAAFLDSIELRPKTNGLSIRRGGSVSNVSFPAGSLMYPVVYGNRAVIADARGSVYFVDPQSASIEASVQTKAVQPFETGFLVDGNRGYFAGRSGNVACIDLDKRSVVWEKKVDSASFLSDIQDAGSLIGLYSKGRLYLLSKATGDLSPVVIGNLAARPYVDGSRVYAPTVSGDIVEYALPSGERKKSISVGGPISAVTVLPGPSVVVAVGMKDGTLALFNPGGER